jgi:ribose/xylose/arabinose/galactoside ABC-type transport system permease subunit
LLNVLRRREVQLVLAILGLFALCTALHPQFGVASNIAFILADSVTIMIVAVGQTIVVLGRGIDLSVSPVLGMAAVSAGFLAADNNLNIWLALLLVLAIGTGLGVGSGFLVSVVGIPPIIATLATLTIYGGWQFIICGGMSVINIPAVYTNFGAANLLPGVPWLVVIGAGVVSVAYLFLKKTVTGRSVYAVGNNADAAFRAGIPVRRILFTTYVISGFLAGLAGLIYLCQIGSATSTSGSDGNTNLMSIAATLIGGTTLLGGRGGPVGSALGAVFLSEALQAMISFRINEIWDPAGVGLLILIAVVADRKGVPVRQLFRQPFRQPAGATR